MKDGSGTETAAGESTVTVVNQGPLYVQGELSIDGAALCRCGKSKNKLFYDNSHETGGF